MAMLDTHYSITGYKVRTMNPLTTRARHNAKRESIENYIIATVCGISLGVLCALFI